MKFSKLAQHFKNIEDTPSRNAMTEQLAELIKASDPDEIGPVMYMLQGKVTPPYVKADFGLGEKMIIRAAARGLNIDVDKFTKIQAHLGDIGLAVEQCKLENARKAAGADPSVLQVFERLFELTNMSGEGSQDRKIDALASLINDVDALSGRYIVRIPAQTLRLGFSDMTVLDALSWYLQGDKSLRKTIERGYHVRPDLGFIASQIRKHGIKGVEDISPTVGTPILMMRAQRLPSPQDIFDKLTTGMIEPKYDGFRLQVHYKKVGSSAEVKLFSRGLDEVTYMYPDLVEGIKHEVKADSIIFEGEAIGFEPHGGNFLPFQETVQRKRKHGIEEKVLTVPLKLFAFEVLYLNDESMLRQPYDKRMSLLQKAIKTTGDIFNDTVIVAESKEMTTKEDVDDAFEDALTKGLEGIIVKKRDGVYEPGARGWNWIKYKRSYSSKIEDTIDCLVMGFDVGKGKRTGFGIGAFLVGVYDASSDMFKTVAKIGTGLSDDEWKSLRDECLKLDIHHMPALYEVDKAMTVDQWVNPGIVVEIKADEITRSSMHTAGRSMRESKSGKALEVSEQGYALRFPRLVKFRPDRKPEDATTVAEIVEMYEHFHELRIGGN